VGLDC